MTAASIENGEDLVRSEVRGRLGVVTLNRPKALNALNVPMVDELDAILTRWAEDPAIEAVLLRSGSERAFCAGGDVRSIGMLPDPADRMALGRRFFGTEYRVNLCINRFPKPFISLINGIAMGGGLGLSIHGSHRVVSEDLRMAMPETVLGLFPDVGATWFLNRCPGAIGRYLALIGPQIGAADALTAGLATHHVPLAAFPALIEALVAADGLDAPRVDSILAEHAITPRGGVLANRRMAIDALFGTDDFNAAVAALEAEAATAQWIEEARSVLHRASPTSLCATWRRMVDGQVQSIEQVLSDDFRMAVRLVGGSDFAEGVRAILVDKDQSPHWSPATLAEVSTADVDALLAPLEEGDPGAAYALDGLPSNGQSLRFNPAP